MITSIPSVITILLVITQSRALDQSDCRKLESVYSVVCTAKPPGKSGSVGQKGDKGDAGNPGPIGPPGNPNYQRVEEMISSRIEEGLQSLMKRFELCYMGMKSGLIPNSAIFASTNWGARHEPYLARLDNMVSEGSTGAWGAKTNTIGEWIGVDFGTVKNVAGVITQGRPQYLNQWVSKFKIACGTDLDDLQFVMKGDSEMIFTGNSDFETKVYNRFPTILTCRFIRIYPQQWNNHMTMRFELVHGHCFDIKQL